MTGVVEALAGFEPGLALASALTVLDRSTVDDPVALMQARARMIACLQADIAYVAHLAAADLPPGDPFRQEAGAAEIATALTWTDRAAHRHLALAQDVCGRWPALHAALATGAIDMPKAYVIRDALDDLDETLATSLVEQILPLASGLTTAQIGHRLRRLVCKLDPAAAARRRRKAVQERRLWHYSDRDGTASLGAAGLPIPRAAAAEERINAIARTARAAGDPRTFEQLRVDTFLDLLEGNALAAIPGIRKGTVDLTVPLETLLGGDEPGQVAGWGPVPADLARDIAAQQTDASWRLSVYDSDVTLLRQATGRKTIQLDGPGSRRFVVDLDQPVASGDPAARHPDAATARFVMARDRTCRFAGCSVPARRTDIDHTTPHAEGGLSTLDNLGCLCRRHHRLKHGSRWRLKQTKPGHFRWRSPLGQIYDIHPDPDRVVPAQPHPVGEPTLIERIRQRP